MVVLLKWRHFLGCVVFSSIPQFNSDSRLRKINFTSSTQRQCTIYLSKYVSLCSPRPHILITAGSRYLWRNFRIYSVNCSSNKVLPWYNSIFLKGKSLDIRPRTSGNLGYYFSPPFLYEYILTLLQRRSSPKTEKDVESHIFHRAYAQNEHVQPLFSDKFSSLML